MSLLDDSMEKFVFLDKRTITDDMGGYTRQWIEGAEIDAAVVFDSSIEARTAAAQDVTSLYTITTKKNIVLEYHDVLKRRRDNKIFRVTSDGDDKYTPKSASLNMRQVSAEEWSIPNDQGTGNT